MAREPSVSKALGPAFLVFLGFSASVVGATLVATARQPTPRVVYVVVTATPGPAQSPTAAPTLAATATALPSATATALPTATATVAPTVTATATATPLPTVTPTATPVPYRSEEFDVAPRTTVTTTFTVGVRSETLQGYFLVSGGNNDVGFRLRGPSGANLINVARVATRYALNLPLRDAGPYTLFFDNQFSFFTGKAVTLYIRETAQPTAP